MVAGTSPSISNDGHVTFTPPGDFIFHYIPLRLACGVFINEVPIYNFTGNFLSSFPFLIIASSYFLSINLILTIKSHFTLHLLINIYYFVFQNDDLLAY